MGKKNRQSDAPVEDNERSSQGLAQPSSEEDDLAAWREAERVRAQRHLARMTAEKIDAIESEIARDILKAAPMGADTIPAEETAKQPVPPAHSATDPFQATIIRHDVNERTSLFDDSNE